MTNVRRIWYWAGANSLTDLATFGAAMANDCKITVAASEVTVYGVIEIDLCSEAACSNLDSVKPWTRG